MKTKFLLFGLLLLILANLLMVYSMNTMSASGMDGFMNYIAENAADSGSGYKPIGKYDGVALVPDNGVSAWRNTAPNEPLNGPEFEVGPDSLFIFKNNQCKPECCGASMSCGGGCVCTTPQQRQYIATRGGNRMRDES
jgi:hypothetical protein